MARRNTQAYPQGMQIIPLPDPGRINLVITPYISGEAIFDMAARLALSGGLEVLDGGNTFNAYRAARALRGLDARAVRALEATRLARAFTCYQVAALLEEMAAAPRPAMPLLILDFLATFGDQSVALRERRRLLNLCLAQMKQIAAHRPVGVWVRRRTVAPVETLEFLARMERAAGGHIWRLEQTAATTPVQGKLF
jgi:hypothetical protein